MSEAAKTLEFKFERTIPAPPADVFDGWLNPKIPGTPWNMGEKHILNPVVDGFFYWLVQGTPHYGLFTEVQRGARLKHTWVSPNTLGEESIVTVTFDKKGKDTLMTLVHSGLPDNANGRGHEKGWNFFLGTFTEQFGEALRKRA